MFGLDNSIMIAFLVVGFAILLIIILFLSYYNILMNIIDFTYPNARFKALGTPFISKRELDYLLDAATLGEVTSHIQPWGYDIPPHADYDSIEKELEKSSRKNAHSAISSLPDSAKHFFIAYNHHADLRQLKNALRLKNAGESDLIKLEVTPSGEFDMELLETIASASDLGDAISKLKATEFGAALEKIPDGASLPQIENALEKQVFALMSSSLSRVDTMVASPLRRFLGTIIDIANLKYIIRAKQDDIPPKEIMDLLVGEGRIFPEDKLKQLAEAKDVAEVLKYLEASHYGKSMTSGSSSISPQTMEIELDRSFLRTVNEICTEHTLTVGPAIKYFACKEFELRNLKVLLQRISVDLPATFVEPLLMVED